jgi:hypothetical protein
MIFFCIGFPTRFAEWCDNVTSRLVRHALGSAEVLSLNTLEELALGVMRTGAAHFVICSRQPAGGLVTALAQTNSRFIAALDEPRAAVYNLAARADCDVVAATRTVASSCAALLGYASMPAGLVLNASAHSHDPILTATEISRHFELDIGEFEISNIVHELQREGISPGGIEDYPWLDESEEALVNGALGAYTQYFSGEDLGKIIWERQLFYIYDEPPAPQPIPATRPVDITGRIRFLVYGPFIRLPPGPWTASVILGFSPEAAGMAYSVEVFAGARLAHARLEPGSESVVEVVLHFSIDKSVDQPVQIRIHNERAAFDGRLALGCVTVTPHAGLRSATRDYLTAVLTA